MSYISRSTRELRGNDRQRQGQRQGAKTWGRDMGQRPGAETKGQRISRHRLSSLSSDYRSLYPCAELGPMILVLDFLFSLTLHFIL